MAERSMFSRRLEKGCLCSLAWWGYYMSQQWSGGEWLTATLPGLPPSTTLKSSLTTLQAACILPRMPFCPQLPTSPDCFLLVSLQVSVWKYLPLRSYLVPCKLPGLLSSGLPEHFASCTAVACIHAGLHRGHDLLEGRMSLTFTVLFDWPLW